MIGKMDQVVSVFTASFAGDDFGGRVETLTQLPGAFFAEVAHLSGDEREHAMRDADKTSVSFKMHNFDGFPASTTSVLVWGGVKYDVVDREYTGNQRLYVTFKAVSGDLNA